MDNQKIKVIHIMQSAGGVAEYVKELLSNLDKKIFENVLIVSNDYKMNSDILNKCQRYYFVDMVRNINAVKDVKSILKVKNILQKENPDVVYLHSSKAGAIGRIALLFDKKTKIIYNAHGWYFNADIGKKKIIFQIIEKILAYKTDKIIAISNSEYESALSKKICKSEKLVLINNGIDINRFEKNNEYRKSTRKKYNIKNNEVLVGIVGRISKQKDPMASIKAAAKIIKKNINIHFMFVGNGDLENNIREYAKNEKIESNIIITGWVNDVEKYIPAFDIALLPSKWEGFGLAILEYMACKKPIIATKVGGIVDILDDDNAFFIDKGDYNGIVTKIEYILQNQKKIKIMVKNNYNRCKKVFSIEQEVQLTEKLIKDILKEN